MGRPLRIASFVVLTLAAGVTAAMAFAGDGHVSAGSGSVHGFTARLAAKECESRMRAAGPAAMAAQLGVRDPDLREIARAYAESVGGGNMGRLLQGCLAGLRLARELERIQHRPGSACTDVLVTPDEGRAHLPVGSRAPAYGTRPATSGPHDRRPLPPTGRVYRAPVPERRAVHNLEHGYVFLAYAPGGASALPAALVGRLRRVASSERKVIAAPYPDLPRGISVALVAWTRIQRCDSSVTAHELALRTASFVERFRGSRVAPDPDDP